MTGATYETERLLLRPHRPDDLEAMLAYHSLAETARYLYRGPMTEQDVRARLADRMATTDRTLAVVLPGTGALIGEIGVHVVAPEHRQGEIGYLVHPDHQGRGYATEAAAVLLGIGFGELDLHRIVGRIDARNAGSARVLEKLGMRREAHLVENEWVQGEWQSEVIYALLAREWAASRP